MPDDKLSRLLSRFLTASAAHYAALEAMDEAGANSHARIIAGLYEAICAQGKAGSDGLLAMVDDPDKVVAGMAAVYSIRYSPGRCLKVLRMLAKEPGLLGFRAGIAIQRWEAGEWEG